MEFLELLLAAKSGDKESRDLLIEKNMGLVWSVVRRFSHRGYEPEDLFQIDVYKRQCLWWTLLDRAVRLFANISAHPAP